MDIQLASNNDPSQGLHTLKSGPGHASSSNGAFYGYGHTNINRKPHAGLHRFPTAVSKSYRQCSWLCGVSAKQADVHEITPQSNYVWIHPDGFCLWQPRYELSAAQCSVDVTWFPFDAQICDLIFESWMLSEVDLNITVNPNQDVLSDYLPTDEWNLTCACS